MADLEKDIAQLDGLLRRLEKEYEQFFCGQLRREPTDTENAALALIRGWANRSIQNPALAFKFGSLVARYNSFRSAWTRRLREKEEGRISGAPRPAAPVPRPAAAASLPDAAKTVAVASANPSPNPSPPDPAEYLTVDPGRETQGLGEFFEVYRRMREEVGESTEKLRAEGFRKALAEKVGKIKESHNCEAVLIRLVKEEGRVRIVARPSRKATAATGGDAS